MVAVTKDWGIINSPRWCPTGGLYLCAKRLGFLGDNELTPFASGAKYAREAGRHRRVISVIGELALTPSMPHSAGGSVWDVRGQTQ